jgi:hypothetical protein
VCEHGRTVAFDVGVELDAVSAPSQ